MSGQPYYNEEQPDPISQEDHQRDAFAALQGADETLTELLSAMSIGPQSVRRHAYAIKSRTKTVESLVEKVVEKRLWNDNDYRVANATDLIGIRILCLFSEDLWDTSNWLLKFVESNCDQGTRLFKSGGLDEAIREVIVYQPGTATEQVYRACYTKIISRYKDRINKKKLQFKKPPPDKMYSSIHIVARAQSNRHDGREYWVEFQIRTALEDVWAEMDHRLFYKSARHGNDALALAREMLSHQKIHLDAISTTTDQIRSTCKASDRDPHADQFIRTMGVEVSIARAGISGAKKQITDAFRALQHDIGKAYGQVESRLSGNNGGIHFKTEDYEEFKHLGERIGDFGAICRGQVPDESKATYFVSMELALSHLWCGLICQSLSETIGTRKAHWDNLCEEHTNSALQIYQGLVEGGEYAEDAFLWFRLAMVHLQLRKDATGAAQAFKKSAERLSGDRDFPPNSQFRIVIPRLYGYAIWSQVADEFREPRREKPDAHVLDAVLLAFETTYGLEHLDVEDTVVRGNLGPDDEKRKTVNNWLSYATAYLTSGGEWGSLEKRGLSEQAFRRALSELAAGWQELDTAAWALHTLTVGYGFLKDDLAQEYARRLIAALDAGYAKEEDDVAWTDRMRADAMTVLS